MLKIRSLGLVYFILFCMLVYINIYNLMLTTVAEQNSFYSVFVFLFLLFIQVLIIFISNIPIKKTSTFFFLSLYSLVIILDSVFRSHLPLYQSLVVLLPLTTYIAAYKISYIERTKFCNKYIIYITLLLIYLLLYRCFNIRMSSRIFSGEMSNVYGLLYFSPIIFFIQFKYIRYVLLFLSFIGIMSSFKRSGVLAMIIALSVYFYTEKYISSVAKRLNILKPVILGVFIIFVLALLLSYFNSITGDVLFSRFDSLVEGGGSGRDQIYYEVFTACLNSDFFNFFIGHGWDSVRINRIDALSAHNDYLEAWFDLGFVFLLFFIVFVYKLVFKAVKLLIEKNKLAPVAFYTLVIFIINSFFSHIILYPIFFAQVTFILGIIDGITQKEHDYNNLSQ